MLRTASIAAGLAVLAAGGLAAQDGAERGAFVIRLGHDTVAVESYVRYADRLEGRVVTRSPRTIVRRYELRWDDAGDPTRLESTIHEPDAPADAPPLARTVTTFQGDSAVVETTRGDGTSVRRVAAPRGTVPLASPSFAIHELVFRRALAAGDSAAVPMLGGGGFYRNVIRRAGDRELRGAGEFGGEVVARLDAEGRLLFADAGGGSTAERVASLDVEALAREFAARDAAGTGLGPLSPRDTARAAVAGATLTVDYSRPSKRGRMVFGGLVPWNEVWRTGANAATHFTTDRDLVLGETPIPAGTYTLFTIPAPSGWTLIVNRQTGQAGTEYDAARDLARIPMQVETLPTPVERFTIAVEEREGGGVLALSWDTIRAFVPFSVK